MEWEQKFKDKILEKGKAAWQSRKVFDLTKTGAGYKASVMGRKMYQVSISVKDNSLTGMRCSCPAGRGGVHCEHIAAVLYAAGIDDGGRQDAAAQTAEKETGMTGREPVKGSPGQSASASLLEAGEQNKTLSAALRQENGQGETARADSSEEQEEMSAAMIMEQWLKMDVALREAEKQKEAGKVAKQAGQKRREDSKKQYREDTLSWEQEVAAAVSAVEARRLARKKRAAKKEKKGPKPEEKKGPQPEEKLPADMAVSNNRTEQTDASASAVRTTEPEPEERLSGGKKDSPDLSINDPQNEKAARRLAREQRKAQRASRKAEQRRQAGEAQRREQAKRQAEEARREQIRSQKAEEASRRAEKKRQEQEAGRRLEKQRQEEAEQRRRETEIEEERLRYMEEAGKRLVEELRKEEEARFRAKEKREAEYSPLNSSWEEESQTTEADSSSLEKFEQYFFFDGTSIKQSMKIVPGVYEEGERLLAEGYLNIRQVYSGYVRNEKERRGLIEAVAVSKEQRFEVRLIFSRTAVTDCYCGCPDCRKKYYSMFTRKSSCGYTAGLLLALERYLKSSNIGDATDIGGERLLSFYQRKRGNLMAADMTERESLRLLPRLTRKYHKLSISFRIGGTKLFIIKKLGTFCQNVKDSATDTYGTSTQINHSQENFTDKGRGWIRFISRIVREEEEFQQRLQESHRYYYGRLAGVGSELNLSGWRLDEFYNQLADETVEFEDKDSGEKKKQTLVCGVRNPRVTMCISEEKRKDDSQFHGIAVQGSLPDLYYGTDAVYYISGGCLNRVDSEFLEKIEPLAELATGSRFSFHVGRNNLSEFYHRILPGLQDVVDITETEPEKFRSYLLPEAQFTFYLDAEEKNVTCQIFARYGDREVSVPGILNLRRQGTVEPFRDGNREAEVLCQAMKYLPETDLEKEELHCGGDEDLVCQMIESGTEKLMEMGEVRCTQRFRNFHVIRSIRVSVGVSVASGLLELDIKTEDLPEEELLDILASYRAKKKYYRMRDGSFVNLDDTSLEMLAELMDAMQMKPKEFVKGKFHLPVYRTLYLDKMLEEHENVYSSRDSHFRQVVKGFKTVKDADFEEPQSLSGIMRNYQKNGYKWLRTLESWQFGGILADDMGLGKTLQVIAVLLAAKQEGREGTSLVVAPASLVYNWGEEFGRFAPELEVVLVTGSRKERFAKIEAYRQADVLVTSYDLLKRDIVNYEEKTFSYEIIDEAQYIKNHTTAAAKAVRVIQSRVRFALTGTPIENRLSELWSIFDYLMPGFLYGYDVFKREIETPVVRGNDESAMKRLQKMAGPFILRRLKEEVLKDLPDKLEENRYVQFGTKQQQLYDAQVLHMRETIAAQDEAEFNKNKIRILAELTRLRQICCDPSLCFENYNGEAAKLEACLELIRSAMDGGHRILLFSQFTSMLDILKERLDSIKIPYYIITGSTSKEKRLALVRAFNEGDVPVFLISLKAGGVGLNLTGADVVIHYDPWWNLAVQNQATDRAHRIGQTKKVTVFKLLAKNTIEEKIQQLQETKRQLAEQVIGGEGGQTSSMSREDILALLEIQEH